MSKSIKHCIVHELLVFVFCFFFGMMFVGFILLEHILVVFWVRALHFSLCVHVILSYGVCAKISVGGVFVCCMLLWLPYVFVCTFVILSPTDYQSILTELQSPAALQSNPYFLEPELPVTPNPTLAHHQPYHYPDSDTPLHTDTHPQPPPWSPEVEPCSGEPDSPPKSPPRPCELALSIPTFELPEPDPSKIRKPHIALNDQLLLSEEEDKSVHEVEPAHKPRSPSFPTMCDLDFDMAYSTSSPSLSSVSSITPSTPDRAQLSDGGERLGVLNQLKEMEVTKEIEKVVEMVAAQLAEENRLVEKWVEQDLIKNVERKCEMITKDRTKMPDEHIILVEQKWSVEQGKNEMNEKGEECKVESIENIQHLTLSLIQTDFKMEKGAAEAETDKEDQTYGLQKVHEGCEESLQKEDRKHDTDRELQFKAVEDVFLTSGENLAPEDHSAADLSPQDWTEALKQLQPSESGSNEEEEEERSKEIQDEALASGSEEKEEDDKEMTEYRDPKGAEEVEHADKNMCSLSGWHSDSSSVNVEPPTPGRSVSSDLLDKQERYK